jgi:hypothetical protein
MGYATQSPPASLVQSTSTTRHARRKQRRADEWGNFQAAQERMFDAEHDSFTTAPTTMAGAAALLDYLGTSAWANDEEQTILEWAFGSTGGYVTEFPTFLGAALRSMIAKSHSPIDEAPKPR